MEIREYISRITSNWENPIIDPKGFDDLGFTTAIRPFEYLSYAEKDLRLGGVRGLVNALFNSKRAIDCQIVNLLRSLGLDSNGNFPSKLERLQELGLIAPRILRKLVRLRNALEHDYHKPTAAEVEDAVDVATLFLEALKPFMSGGAYMSGSWLADDASVNPWPIQKKNGITSWEDKKKPKFTFSSGIYIDSDLANHTIHFQLVHDNKELAEHRLVPRHPIYADVQKFLLKCRPENRQYHSKRGAREFISILQRWV